MRVHLPKREITSRSHMRQSTGRIDTAASDVAHVGRARASFTS